MPKGLWLRDGSRAVPADERSLEFMQSIKDGTLFIADTHGARNPKQLALWWCLCKLLADQMDTPSEKVSDDIKVALGHADTYVNKDGTVYVKPKSISFESLSQEEFNNLFKAAVNTIARWLESAPSEVMDAFNTMVADKRYAGMRR
jgi:hypothetical protein